MAYFICFTWSIEEQEYDPFFNKYKPVVYDEEYALKELISYYNPWYRREYLHIFFIHLSIYLGGPIYLFPSFSPSLQPFWINYREGTFSKSQNYLNRRYLLEKMWKGIKPERGIHNPVRRRGLWICSNNSLTYRLWHVQYWCDKRFEQPWFLI